MNFLLFPVGEEWFSRFMRIPSGIFWRCKIDEILTVILHLVLRMILLIWFSSKVRNLLRNCLRSTASPLCQRWEATRDPSPKLIELQRKVACLLTI